MTRLLIALTLTVAACGDDTKRPLGATCTESGECASGLCLEQICVDPSQVGQTRWFLVNPYWAVEDATVVGALIPGLRFHTDATITNDSLGIVDECVVDAFVRAPGDGPWAPLSTHARCNEDPDTVPATRSGATLTIDLPEQEDQLDSGLETIAPWVIALTDPDGGAPADAELLVGQSLKHYTILPPGAQVAVDAREVNLFLAVRRAPSNIGTVAGAWGFIGLMVESEAASRELEYNLGVFGASITTGGSSTAGTIGIVAGREELAVQGIASSVGNSVSFRATEAPLDPAIPLVLDGQGGVELDDPELPFVGAVTPSGDFMVLTATTPDLATARANTQLHDDQASTLVHEVLFGVKRAALTNELLAGRVYQLYRQELLAQADRFGVASVIGTLTFDATGTSATITNDYERAYVAHTGDLVDQVDSDTPLTVSVTLDDDDMLSLASDPAGLPLPSYSAWGYVQAGGNLIVLGDHARDVNGSVQVAGAFGAIIGICTSCTAR